MIGSQCVTRNKLLLVPIRESGWKSLIRFFITLHITNKFQRHQQQYWRQCGHLKTNHSPIFWTCTQLTPLWDSIFKLMDDIMAYATPKEPKTFLLGLLPRDLIPKKDRYIFKILLTATRKAITRNWISRASARDYRRNTLDRETDFLSTTQRTSFSTTLD